jgi:hypothetical protein
VTLERLTARLDLLEAETAIRAVMADYLRLCDQLDAATPLEELGELFTPEAVWTGSGARYAAAFGGHHGRAAILAMLDTYRTPPHFAFNAHFLTSEKITVTADTAQGHWMMLQTATYTGGGSDLRAARLSVDFVRDADSVHAVDSAHSAAVPDPRRWRIHRFVTENLFSRPIDRWDDPAPVPVPASPPAAATRDPGTPR